MTNFQPINESMTKYDREGRAMSGCVSQQWLSTLALQHRTVLNPGPQHLSEHDFPHCWGYTLFRTVYIPGSDEAFKKALERLQVYARHFAYDGRCTSEHVQHEEGTRRYDEELWSRNHMEVIEDPETLAGATVEDVGRWFDSWISEHVQRHDGQPVRPGKGSYFMPNVRYSVCIMLDQESIDNILAMSEDPNISVKEDPEMLDRWVRMVGNWNFELNDDSARAWFRGGIHDAIWNLWFTAENGDADMGWDELCWKDEDGSWSCRGHPGSNYFRDRGIGVTRI